MTSTTTPSAADIMNRHLHTVEQDLTLSELTAFMLKHQVSIVPVVKQEGAKQCLLGLVSEADCLEYLSNELFYGNPTPPQTAGTIMKRHLVCVTPDEDLFALASILTSHRYRHIPVVKDHELLGIVSRRDVLAKLDEFYRRWIVNRDRERFPVDLHEIMNIRFVVSNRR
jgi:CBS domain-containing protein